MPSALSFVLLFSDDVLDVLQAHASGDDYEGELLGLVRQDDKLVDAVGVLFQEDVHLLPIVAYTYQ